MKQFGKVLIWLVILGGILFGVYMMLPEYPQSFVKSIIQPVVNSQAKERIIQVKNLKNDDLNTTYQKILENGTKNTCWVYEEGVGIETVTFYGTGATINISDVKDHDDHLYTSTNVKFEFVIKGKSVDIKAYIGKDAQDDEIKAVMLQQLFQGK